MTRLKLQLKSSILFTSIMFLSPIFFYNVIFFFGQECDLSLTCFFVTKIININPIKFIQYIDKIQSR